jgi:hypothetical protein
VYHIGFSDEAADLPGCFRFQVIAASSLLLPRAALSIRSTEGMRELHSAAATRAGPLTSGHSVASQIQGLPTMVFVGMDKSKPALRTEGLLPAQTIREIVENELQ